MRKTEYLVFGVGVLISFVFSLMFSWSTQASDESLTLETYYPAPYGIYSELTATGKTLLATERDNVGIGTTSPNAKAKLHIDKGLIYADGKCGDASSDCSDATGFRNHVRLKNYSPAPTWDTDWEYSRIDVEKDSDGERVRIAGTKGVEIVSHKGIVEGTTNTTALDVRGGGIQAAGDICAHGGADCVGLGRNNCTWPGSPKCFNAGGFNFSCPAGTYMAGLRTTGSAGGCSGDDNNYKFEIECCEP